MFSGDEAEGDHEGDFLGVVLFLLGGGLWKGWGFLCLEVGWGPWGPVSTAGGLWLDDYHLDGLADGGNPVSGGRGGGDDGVRHARPRCRVLGRAAGVRGRRRRAIALAVGLVVGAERAVGGGQGGALDLRTHYSGSLLQAERLQLLTGTVWKAVGDLGLWPDLR